MKGITKGVQREVKLDPYGTIIDLLIPRSPRFINLIEKPSGIDLERDTGEDIQFVAVDVTHTLYEDDITDKFWKGYQSKNTYLYVVLNNPEATSADTNFDKYLNKMPDDRYPDHIKVILIDDFNSVFRIEPEISILVDKLSDLIEDCLDLNDITKQKNSLKLLYDLNENARNFLKHPLSHQRLVDFTDFFNI